MTWRVKTRVSSFTALRRGQGLAGTRLQRAPGAPHCPSRGAVPAIWRTTAASLCPLLRAFELSRQGVKIRGAHELRPAVLAYPDAGLRALDAPAADAFPCLKRALIPACHYGHVETVRYLLTTPIAVDHVNRLGWTALLEAVILGDGGAAHTVIVRLLLAARADPNKADAQGVTPLRHAVQRGQTDVARLLRDAGGR